MTVTKINEGIALAREAIGSLEQASQTMLSDLLRVTVDTLNAVNGEIRRRNDGHDENVTTDLADDEIETIHMGLVSLACTTTKPDVRDKALGVIEKLRLAVPPIGSKA